MNDVVTCIDHPSVSPLGGGTKQILSPICNDVDLRIAINAVAFRPTHRGRANTENTKIRSNILDLLYTKKVNTARFGVVASHQPSLTQGSEGCITREGQGQNRPQPVNDLNLPTRVRAPDAIPCILERKRRNEKMLDVLQ